MSIIIPIVNAFNRVAFILGTFGGTYRGSYKIPMPLFTIGPNIPLADVELRRVRHGPNYHNRSTGVDTAVFGRSR